MAAIRLHKHGSGTRRFDETDEVQFTVGMCHPFKGEDGTEHVMLGARCASYHEVEARAQSLKADIDKALAEAKRFFKEP